MWNIELPELAYDVLELDLDRLEPARHLSSVQAKVADISTFYEQYKPLILDEVIAALKLSLERAQRKTSRYGVQITSADHFYYYPEDDITILNLKGEHRIDCVAEMHSFRFIMAEVLLGSAHYIGMIDIFQRESRLVLKGNLVKILEENPSFHLIPLVSLVSLDRMYNVCCEMPDSPVLAKIRQGQTDSWPILSAEVLAQDTTISTSLNDSQKMAVRNFADAEMGLYVLQGPPGTGKTTTIVEMLRQLMKKPGRVLVCAPSNKAVQVLAERSLHALAQEPLLLVSVGSKVTAGVEEISIDNWVKRYPDKLHLLIAEFDLASQLLSSNIGGKSLLTASGDIDFEKITRCVHHLQTTFLQLKEIFRICFRYVLLSRELSYRYLELATSMITQYIEILDGVQKQIMPQAFPALGAASVVPSAAKLDLVGLRKVLSKQYADLSNFILKDIVHQYFPTDDNALLARTKILFCTLSVAGRVTLQRKCAKQEPFSSIIMDEAGQAVEPEGLIPFVLAPRAQKILLAGDTRQLPATTISRSSKNTHLDWSMMWRLIEENHQAAYPLTVQYRMRPAIQHFPSNRYYEGRLSGHPSILFRQCHSSHFVPTAGCKLWVEIKGREERHDTTFRNQAEAVAIIDIVRAIRERDTKSHIGIISFYSGQIGLITRLMHVEKQKNKMISEHNITISTVDGFQGDEKDIIIVSFVRANDNQGIGFLNDFRRLNVAITRAKDVLIVLGSGETFIKTPENELKQLLEFCIEANTVTTLDCLLKEIRGVVSKPSVAVSKTVEKPLVLPVVRPIGNVANRAAAHKSKGVRAKIPSVSAVYTTEELLARATRHYERMEYEKTIESYNKVLEREPQRFDIYELLACCYDSLHDTMQAQMMREIGISVRSEVDEIQETQRLGKYLPMMHAPVLPAPQTGFITVGLKQKLIDGIKKARVFTDGRQFKEAEQLYLELHDEAPEHADVLLGLGWCMHKQRKNTEAIRYFELALTFDQSPLGYQGLILSKKYSGNVEAALDTACDGVDHFPYSRTLYRLKEELEQQSQSAIAMRQSFYATKLKAIPAAAYSRPTTTSAVKTPLSLFFTPAAASAKAMSSVTSSVDKKLLEKKLQEARHLSESRQGIAAEEKYRVLLRDHPQCAEVLLGLGLALNRQRKNELAIPYLEQALTLEKTSLVYQQLAIAYKHLGDFTSAMRYVTEGLSVYSASPGLCALKEELARGAKQTQTLFAPKAKPVFDLKSMIAQAKKLSMGGKLPEALELYKQALHHAPNHYEVLLGFAWTYNKQANYVQAIRFFQRGLEESKTNDANLHYGLAIAFRGQDNLEGAICAINKALQVKPNHPDYIAFKERLESILSAQRPGYKR
jgi:tetratricopeptide (TPR) repeat protein/DNA polymerase III delta prime subunit